MADKHIMTEPEPEHNGGQVTPVLDKHGDLVAEVQAETSFCITPQNLEDVLYLLMDIQPGNGLQLISDSPVMTGHAQLASAPFQADGELCSTWC